MYSYESAASYALFRPYLQDGEELFWTGKPYTSVPFRPNIGVLIFSIFWLGFAVFWTVMASAAGGAFGLFGLPFIGVGCFLLYSQVIGQKQQMKKTYYAVTDRRAIILTEKPSGIHFAEFPFSNMTNVTMTAVRGETGTILFPTPYYATPYVSRRGIPLQNAQQTVLNGFYMIDNVQTVCRLISERINQNNSR